MKFLLRQESDRSVGKVLVIQTCNPNLLDHVTKDVCERFPEAKVTVLLQRQMRPWILFRDGVEYIDNPESGRKELLEQLKQTRYDLMVTVLSGESGYWKLKLLPLLAGPEQVRVYNRFARSFPLNVFNMAAYLAEVAGGVLGAADSSGITLRLAARKILSPFIALYLLWFLRRRTLAVPKQAKNVSPGEDS